ncbi:hypothetical protein [Spiroplasma endosymbiont of Amphibalanus improvisus]|uniref:hypothetical protein n=1 Tax=Spiroplasma endosymbiont of Amphibalanus improvisus TaxID=3066327 RepID=UPI00313B405E
MHLKKIKVYLKIQKIDSILGYQISEKIDFFQFLILNTILNFPDKTKTIYEVLKEFLQLSDVNIFYDILNNLIEDYNMISVNLDSNDNFVESEMIYYKINNFKFSEAAINSFNEGYLLNSRNTKVKDITFVFDDWNSEIKAYDNVDNALDDYVSEEEINKFKKNIFFDKDNIILEYPKINVYNFELLVTILNNDVRMRKFMDDKTSIEYFQISNEKLNWDNKDKNFELLNKNFNLYLPAEVEIDLSDTNEIRLNVLNDNNNLKIYFEKNKKYQEQFIFNYLQILKKYFNGLIDVSKINNISPLAFTKLRQDPLFVESSFNNPEILIINARYSKNIKENLEAYKNIKSITTIVILNSNLELNKFYDIPVIELANYEVVSENMFFVAYIEKKHWESYYFNLINLLNYNDKLILAHQLEEKYTKNIALELDAILLKKIEDKLSTLKSFINEENKINSLIKLSFLKDAIHGNNKNILILLDNLKEIANNKNDVKTFSIINNAINQIYFLDKNKKYQNILETELKKILKSELNKNNELLKSYKILQEIKFLNDDEKNEIIFNQFKNQKINSLDFIKFIITYSNDVKFIENIFIENRFNSIQLWFDNFSNSNFISEEQLNCFEKTGFLTNLLINTYKKFIQIKKIWINKRADVIEDYILDFYKSIDDCVKKINKLKISKKEILIIQILNIKSILEKEFRNKKFGINSQVNPEIEFPVLIRQFAFGKAWNLLYDSLEIKLNNYFVEKLQINNDNFYAQLYILEHHSNKKIQSIFSQLKNIKMEIDKKINYENNGNNINSENELELILKIYNSLERVLT